MRESNLLISFDSVDEDNRSSSAIKTLTHEATHTNGNYIQDFNAPSISSAENNQYTPTIRSTNGLDLHYGKIVDDIKKSFS
jgi:hypothetical protein